MCHLYSLIEGQSAIIALTRALTDSTGNMPPLPGIYPDHKAPVVANKGGTRELCLMRWGMPSSPFALNEATKKRVARLDAKRVPYNFKELKRMTPDPGAINIRKTSSDHWKRWLGVENRCVVPFTTFSEHSKADGNIWFAVDDTRPLAVFAGIWTSWTSTRKIEEGKTTNDLFGILTTSPNDVVGPIHPNAMPVIFTKPAEIETWLTASAEEALKLQKPLPNGALKIVPSAENDHAEYPTA